MGELTAGYRMTGDVLGTGVGIQTPVEGMIVRLEVFRGHYQVFGAGRLDGRNLGHSGITVYIREE
jgi:hypothetical protein